MIYFLIDPEDRHSIKIGYTKHLKDRISAYSSQYRTKFEVLAILPGDKPEETALHERFKHIRIHQDGSAAYTEWFYATRELVEFILCETMVCDLRTFKWGTSRKAF